MTATIPHKFNIVRFQRPELIPDIEQFLPVSIFKLADTIPQKFKVAFNLFFKPVNSGHHYLPTYQILMISDNVEFLPPIFYTVFWQPF
jgi:hypothetical protein